MTEYFELLNCYENDPLTIQNDIPTIDDIHNYIIELEARYHKLRNYYELQMLPILKSFKTEIEMSDIFHYSDIIIKCHRIDFEKDSISMMLGKIMYMLREPDYGSPFHLSDLTHFDFHKYYMQGWFDINELAKCQYYFIDFHVNLYEYFEGEEVITDKMNVEI